MITYRRSMAILDDDLIQAIVEKISRGNYEYVAAAANGVSWSTYKSWKRAGKKQLEGYASGDLEEDKLDERARLVAAVDKAVAAMECRVVEDVLESDDPKIKLEFLKKRFNKRWNNMPVPAVDEDTGEVAKADPLQILADRLAALTEGE